MSIKRYLPAIGTAGFERMAVSGYNLAPRPPPIIIPKTSFIAGMAASTWDGCDGYYYLLKSEIRRDCNIKQFPYQAKCPLYQRGHFLNNPSGYNLLCRRRESNPHSRREHDFESCASAYSATSAFCTVPHNKTSGNLRSQVYHSQHEGQDKIS